MLRISMHYMLDCAGVATPVCFAEAIRQPSLPLLPIKSTEPNRMVVEGPAIPDARKPWPSTSSVDSPAPPTEQVSSVPNLHMKVLNSLWQP